MRGQDILSSWSGGKDSCLACFKVLQQGGRVKYLLNFVSREFNRCCFHGIPADLLKRQAERVGIPLVQRPVSPDMQKYEEEFKEAVTALKTIPKITRKKTP
ncbi:MAG TPA: hypothetical protein PK876_04175, partial [Elusimicrobiota bacterium]|nr:hypothetical protein [Elusimicrobiota bacterium]